MLFVRQTGDSLICTFSEKGFIARDNLHIIISDKVNLFLMLGIINSKLMDYIYTCINPKKGEALAQVKKHHLEILPIIKDFNEPNKSSLLNEIILNSKSLTKLNKEKQSASLQTQLDQLQSRIDFHEDKINCAVYQLYFLTPDEIKLIESSPQK